MQQAQDDRFKPLLLAFAQRRLDMPDPEAAKTWLEQHWEGIFKNALPGQKKTLPMQARLLASLEKEIEQYNSRTREQRSRMEKEYNPLSASSMAADTQDAAPYYAEAALKALALLEELSFRDASLVRMCLSGIKTVEMAQKELSWDKAGTRELDARAVELQERLERPGTGALARFNILFERCLKNLDARS